ncbi:MAG: zinc ribbon-containing protein [Pseudomonadota bacterium]
MSPQKQIDKKHLHAYDRMMERVKATMAHAGYQNLRHAVETAKDKAVELGELTREEAERIGDYLARDIEDAGTYLADTGGELKDWLRFDLRLIEDRLLEMFTAAADQTKLELLMLAERARRASLYHSGEITGIGTLQCDNCGKLLHFHTVSHIPPCPSCHGGVFKRPERSI